MKGCWSLSVFNVAFVLSVLAFVHGEDEYKITDCDRNIAEILCADYLNEVGSCAEFMPKDEQKLFFECATDLKVSSEVDWIGLLNGVCSGEDPAQVASDVIFCWNDKMNATIDKMGDDKVYPYEHFKCKERLYTEAVEKTSCLCQLEKGFSCIKVPTAPWDKALPTFG